MSWIDKQKREKQSYSGHEYNELKYNEQKNNEHQYDDIINLPHHVSSKHAPMPALDRAAQFSPFAALTGHNDAIKETARLTEEQIELDEDSKEMLNAQLLQLKSLLDSKKYPPITITYFKPDEKKIGGSYITFTGVVKKFNEYERTIIFENGETILIDNLLGISYITTPQQLL